MRAASIVPMFSVCLVTTLLLASGPVAADDHDPEDTEHPMTVALVEVAGEWAYRHFPRNVLLYVFDGDSPGKSACYLGCAAAWPPLRVDSESPDQIGDWKAITRDDGRKQWTYKGRPVYTRFHDKADDPQGIGIDPQWHALVP